MPTLQKFQDELAKIINEVAITLDDLDADPKNEVAYSRLTSLKGDKERTEKIINQFLKH